MRLQLLRLLLFLTANFLLCLAHIHFFQSTWPFSAWVSIGLHVLGLLFFPYARAFTSTSKYK
jgi:hypothetical protein